MEERFKSIRNIDKWLILVSLVIGIEHGTSIFGQALHAPEPLWMQHPD